MQAISDEVFVYVHDELVERGMSELVLELLLSVSQIAVQRIFAEVAMISEQREGEPEGEADDDGCDLMVVLEELGEVMYGAEDEASGTAEASFDAAGTALYLMLRVAKRVLGDERVHFLMNGASLRLAETLAEEPCSAALRAAVIAATERACEDEELRFGAFQQLVAIRGTALKERGSELLSYAQANLEAEDLAEIMNNEEKLALLSSWLQQKGGSIADSILAGTIAANAGSCVVEGDVDGFESACLAVMNSESNEAQRSALVQCGNCVFDEASLERAMCSAIDTATEQLTDRSVCLPILSVY